MLWKENYVRISFLLWAADIVVGYALFEMQNYLTQVWKLSLIHAALILNIWNGLSRIFPLLFLYLVDKFLGHFKLLVVTNLAYTTGITMMTLSTPPVTNAKCKRYESECIGPTQKGLLYAGVLLVAVGAAGNFASIRPFLQENQVGHQVRSVAVSTQALRLSGLMLVSVVGGVLLPYVITSRVFKFGIPAIFSALGTFLFVTGSHGYKKAPPPYDSPLFNVFKVLVASLLKCSRSYPDPDDCKHYHSTDEKKFSPTRCLRRLQKAAIILPGEDTQRTKSWTLCSIAEVEEAKIAVRMVPMWITFVVCHIVASVGDTYFVEQASKLNRNIGKLKPPIQVLLLARNGTKGGVGLLVRKLLKHPEHASAPSFGVAAGMTCSLLCCITAALMERKRLHVVRSQGLLDQPDDRISMSIYWLVFQFILLGGLEALLANSVSAYYIHESPDSMENYVDSFIQGVSGLGYMCSALSVYAVGKVSERGGHTNWFQYTLNRSRLDRYYWVLAALSTANLVVFVIVAACYSYKKPERGGKGDDTGCSDWCLQSWL